MTGDQLGTFMYVPRKPDEVRALAVTRRGLLAAAGLATLVLLFISIVAFNLLSNQPNTDGSLTLRRENRALVAELDKMEHKLSTLDGQMSILMRRNEELRILADLPAIPVEVSAVGVGGPGHEGVGGLPALEAAAAGDLVRRLDATEGDLDFLLRRSRLVSRSMEEAETIIRAKTERWSSTPSVWPTDGFLSSPFSYARRHPILGSFRPHFGVDISARAGNKVVATADGLVTYAGWRNGSGYHIEIDHGYGLMTTYSHCEKLLVKAGDRVHRGTPVGLVGSTGFSIGPHVHYEVHQNGQPVDPTKFIFPNVVSD
jgi:hypothetical protein